MYGELKIITRLDVGALKSREWKTREWKSRAGEGQVWKGKVLKNVFLTILTDRSLRHRRVPGTSQALRSCL